MRIFPKCSCVLGGIGHPEGDTQPRARHCGMKLIGAEQLPSRGVLTDPREGNSFDN